MLSSFRIFEVSLYAVVNFLPYLIFASYIFYNRSRFSKRITIISGLITILVLYMKYLLKVEFGNHMVMVFLINGVGVFLGLSLGILVGAVSSSNENVKQWIVMGITMLGCYLAGMMDSSMKYKVQENAPFLGYINPSNLLTDAYYSLYYYPDMKRTMTNLAIMCGFSILFCVTGVIALRRQQYESI